MYAFIGADGLVVGRADQVVYRVAATNGTDVQWTLDGRFAFTIDRPASGSGIDQIIALDVLSGATIVRRCDCMSAAAVGGSDVLWIDQKGRANRLSLSDKSTEAHPVTIKMPTGVIARQVFNGVGDTFPLLATPRGSEWDDTTGVLYEVQSGGSGRLMLDLPRINYITVMAAHADPSGVRYLYAAVEGQGDCAHPGPVYLTDPATHESIATDVTDVLGGKTPEVADVFLSDGWWGSDGEIYGQLQSSICGPDGGKAVLAPQVWRLSGRRWVAYDAETIRFRDLSSGDRLVVDTNYALYLRSGGRRVKVAEDVRSIEPQPVKSR